MSADAMARLRVASTLDESVDFGGVRVRLVDLRALLDAYAEALDALERFVPRGKGMGFGGMDSKFDRENATAVLAKAGRR